jgi:2-amino-4-hydroxy-6-hydroxymethyldihydropteridine diphosphokinase
MRARRWASTARPSTTWWRASSATARPWSWRLRLRAIEEAHGRLRDGPKFSSRTLDIDLLTLGDQVVHAGKLELPRDEILKYAFVLRPLADVAPEERHPLVGRSYRELWQGFDQAAQPLWPVAGFEP